MATWDDVRKSASALPGVEERLSHGDPMWFVGGRGFVWERPLRASDREALGDAAPDGPIVAFRVAEEGVKRAMIEAEPAVYFTTPHFDGYPVVLARLDVLDAADLRALVLDAWDLRATKRLREQLRNPAAER